MEKYVNLDVYLNKRWVKALALFLLFTLIGLIKTSMFVSERMASGATELNFKYFLINEMTGSYTAFILLPLLFWFFNRFRMTRRNFISLIPLYLIASMLFGAAHTVLMWLSRKAIYAIGNYGPFHYGKMWERLFMEYHNQIFVFLTFWLVVSFFRYAKERQDERLKRVRLEEALTQAKLQSLQMQLNPHFLFNTLNMISSTMYRDVKTADSMIANLSDLLRQTLKKKDSEFHRMDEELDILELYLKIMRTRFSDRLKIDMEIDPETRVALVPGFILQPLVENAIKYGGSASGFIEILIKAKKIGSQLSLIVRDGGPGFSDSVETVLSSGVGLSNLVERLDKHFSENYEFRIENLKKGAGMQVIIYIPFRRA